MRALSSFWYVFAWNPDRVLDSLSVYRHSWHLTGAYPWYSEPLNLGFPNSILRITGPFLFFLGWLLQLLWHRSWKFKPKLELPLSISSVPNWGRDTWSLTQIEIGIVWAWSLLGMLLQTPYIRLAGFSTWDYRINRIAQRNNTLLKSFLRFLSCLLLVLYASILRMHAFSLQGKSRKSNCNICVNWQCSLKS